MTNHPLDDAARFDQERNCIPPAPVARVNKPSFDSITRELFAERARQERKHGPTNLRKRAELGPIGAFLHWQQILGEELGEVSRAYLEGDYAHMRKEMLESAAVLIAMVEYGDEDGWFPAKQTQPTPPVERRVPNSEFTRACWNGGPNARADRRKGERRDGARRQAYKPPDRRHYHDGGNGHSPRFDRRVSAAEAFKKSGQTPRRDGCQRMVDKDLSTVVVRLKGVTVYRGPERRAQHEQTLVKDFRTSTRRSDEHILSPIGSGMVQVCQRLPGGATGRVLYQGPRRRGPAGGRRKVS